MTQPHKTTVRIEPSLKFLVYVGIGVAAFLMLWSVRHTALSIGAILFMAFILNAGLRPVIAAMSDVRYKDVLLSPIRLIRNLGIVLAQIFGQEEEAAEILGTASKGGRKVWRRRTRQSFFVQKLNLLLEKRLGRGLSIAIVYVLFFAFLVGLFLLLATEFTKQLLNLFNALPGIIDTVATFLEQTFPAASEVIPFESLQTDLQQYINEVLRSEVFSQLVTGNVSSLPETITDALLAALGVVNSVAELVITGLTTIIVSIYMLQSPEPVYEGSLQMLGTDAGDRLRGLLSKIEQKLGAWLNGQILLMLIIGSATYLLLIIPGFIDPNYTLDEYALPLALLAGLLEALPNIGPTITTIITGLLAISTSGVGALVYVLIAFMSLQQLEAVFIVPQVMRRAIGISPIVSILGILAGFQIGGVLGAILAIPLIGISQITFVEVWKAYQDHKLDL